MRAARPVRRADGGDTDLNALIPLCQNHHTRVTDGELTVTDQPDTGTCTWTNPTGIIHTHPPPA